MKAHTVPLVSRIDDNNEKAVLKGTLVAQMDRYKEKMEATIHSIRPELDDEPG
jgi:hypothetical protein